jgi:hypothetical protein
MTIARVEVTSEDRATSAHGPYTCPTALAIARALGVPRVRVSRCNGGVAVQVPPKDAPDAPLIDRPFIRLPNAAWAFETAYDKVVEVWGDDEPGRLLALAAYSFTFEAGDGI